LAAIGASRSSPTLGDRFALAPLSVKAVQYF
jgi:hypothetical protein